MTKTDLIREVETEVYRLGYCFSSDISCRRFRRLCKNDMANLANMLRYQHWLPFRNYAVEFKVTFLCSTLGILK